MCAQERYREMAAAAAKSAEDARSARDRAVYQALAKGWTGLAGAMNAESKAKKSPATHKDKKRS